MFEKKNFLLNCDVCDTRKMKEEDYSGYEKIAINADVIIVNDRSKSILNRLPLSMNHDAMIELPDDVNINVKSINGHYEITGTTAESEHTLLVINGSLKIHPGTEEVLRKYYRISVNGSVKCPKSLEAYLSKVTVNGSVSTYPDDCVILKSEFEIDKYFPLRTKENGRYYAEKYVLIKDPTVDISKLAQKNVTFLTQKLIVPENIVEACAPLFDEQTDFVVVPNDMELLCGKTTFTENLVTKFGNRLFIYGKLTVDEDMVPETLRTLIEKLIVRGTLALTQDQLAALTESDVEYDKLEIIKKGRKISNLPIVKLDNSLFDNSPDGIQVTNAATVIIARNVAPETILEKLTVTNCAFIKCSEEQEGATTAVSVNVAKIGSEKENDEGATPTGGILGSIFGAAKDLANTRLVNADSYIL